jgi:uncharacterized protein YegL
MRRLPIYFLIDISESMVGEQMQLVEEGMASIVKELKTDPYALETAWVSIIVFAGQAKTLVPLQEIVTFYPPKFPIGSGTSLSKGLGHLMFELRSNIVKTTADRKGDWKPIIFLFTDGIPTDETKAAIAEWKQNWQRSANLVAISLSSDADTKLLSELTENVLLLKNTTPSAYKEFFKWVTASIKVSSISVESNGSGFELAKLESGELEKLDTSKLPAQSQMVDPNFVVIAGKCQNTKRPYLMKYRKTLSASGISDFQTLSYKLVGAFQVDNTYYELSDNSGSKQKINTEELIGAPTCPCCGNQIAFAMCGCGEIHCLSFEEVDPKSDQKSTCPSCGNSGKYGMAEGGGFDVNRTQG